MNTTHNSPPRQSENGQLAFSPSRVGDAHAQLAEPGCSVDPVKAIDSFSLIAIENELAQVQSDLARLDQRRLGLEAAARAARSRDSRKRREAARAVEESQCYSLTEKGEALLKELSEKK
jgi:hypothetical protein